MLIISIEYVSDIELSPLLYKQLVYMYWILEIYVLLYLLRKVVKD